MPGVRSTSRTSKATTQPILICQPFLHSSRTALPVRLSDTLRFVHYHSPHRQTFVLIANFACTLQVGDGLEMYVILAAGRATAELVEATGAREITQANTTGNRVFVVRRDLKRD